MVKHCYVIYVYNKQIWIGHMAPMQQISNGLLLVSELHLTVGKGSITEQRSIPLTTLLYDEVLCFDWN